MKKSVPRVQFCIFDQQFYCIDRYKYFNIKVCRMRSRWTKNKAIPLCPRSVCGPPHLGFLLDLLGLMAVRILSLFENKQSQSLFP